MYSPSFIEQYNNKGVMYKHSERGKQMDNVTTTVVESAQEYSNDIEYYVEPFDYLNSEHLAILKAQKNEFWRV